MGYLGSADIASEALWGKDGLVTITESPVITSSSPNTDGLYSATWMPRVAGSYIFSANYTDHGGLLATYFRQMDRDRSTGAVLTDEVDFVCFYLCGVAMHFFFKF